MIGRDRGVTEGGLSGSGEEGSPEAARESLAASVRVPAEKSERPIVAIRLRESGATRRGYAGPEWYPGVTGSGRRGRSLETRAWE
jgi:hypothetical protein